MLFDRSNHDFRHVSGNKQSRCFLTADLPLIYRPLCIYWWGWLDLNQRLVISSEVTLAFAIFRGICGKRNFRALTTKLQPHFQRSISSSIATYQRLHFLSSIFFNKIIFVLDNFEIKGYKLSNIIIKERRLFAWLKKQSRK